MQNAVLISLELAKSLWTLIADAKHPHHENKVIEQVKAELRQCIERSMTAHSKTDACVPAVAKQEVKPEEQADPKEPDAA